MTTTPPQTDQISRIERAFLLLAYFVELDGDVHVPMYEKFEAELAELRAKTDAMARARARLAFYKLRVTEAQSSPETSAKIPVKCPFRI